MLTPSTSSTWLNLDALAHRLLPEHDIHRIRYFTAKVVAWPDCEAAVVFSNDADLAEPIRMACHDYGTPVGIFNPGRLSRASWQLRALPPAFLRQINEQALAACQFPQRLADGQGDFQKPGTW